MKWSPLAFALCLPGVLACGDDDTTEPGDAGRDAGAPTNDDVRDASPAPVQATPGSGFGDVYSGGEFHLGPVDFEETQYHNACAAQSKYLPAVRATAGSLLAGVWGGLPEVERFCDTCIRVDTDAGKTAVLRVVTYGDTTPNSLDVSPDAMAILDSGEYPRAMHWQWVRCPESGPIQLEFKDGAHEFWTAFWVRNARMPIAKVETKGVHHDFTSVAREGDGAVVDYQGVGNGPFTIRITATDGQVLEEDFSWPSGGISGLSVTGSANFE